MSSYRKNRSYRKMEDIHAFPDDFFSTLNVSNIKKGPKMSRSICRQVKNHDKSLSRVCKRERSLDITESYLIATPDVNNHDIRVRFPKINQKRCNNSSMYDQRPLKKREAELGYEMEVPDRSDLNRKRLHRYMKSEDRIRRGRHNLFKLQQGLNINARENQALFNSPNRK